MAREVKETNLRYGVVNFERRKHPRISIDLPIEYRRIDSPVPQSGRAINASEEGMLVYLSERLSIGEHLKLRVFFASGLDLNLIELIAQVVWMDVHMGEGWGDYRTGLRFVEISSENLDKLKFFLRSLAG